MAETTYPKRLDGRKVDENLLYTVLDEIEKEFVETRNFGKFQPVNYDRAKNLFIELSTNKNCEDFLTLPAYKYITKTRWI